MLGNVHSINLWYISSLNLQFMWHIWRFMGFQLTLRTKKTTADATMSSNGVIFLFIPRPAYVAGYNVFALALISSVRLSVTHTSVRPSGFQKTCQKNYVFTDGFSSSFAYVFCTMKVSLWIVNGKISIISYSLSTLVNVQKWIWPLVLFNIWTALKNFPKMTETTSTMSTSALGLFALIKLYKTV